MSAVDSFVQGGVFYQGSLAELADVLAVHDLNPTVGAWSLRVFEPSSHFKIAYVGNISPDAPFEIAVDGYDIPLDIVVGWCERVAGCLRDSGIRFEMTHFSGDQEEIRDYGEA